MPKVCNIVRRKEAADASAKKAGGYKGQMMAVIATYLPELTENDIKNMQEEAGEKRVD